MFVRLRGNGVLDREEDETVVVTIIAYDTPDGPLRVRRQTTASVRSHLLTPCLLLMDSSFWFDTINLGYSTVHF